MTFGEDLGWGSSVEESQQNHGPLHRSRWQLHRHGELLHEEPLREDHRRPRRPPPRSPRPPRDRDEVQRKPLSRRPERRRLGTKVDRLGLRELVAAPQTDYIDLYWLHNWDVHTPIEETMAALDDLVRAGKVRYLGVSDTPAWKIAEANVTARFRGWSAFIGLQIEYSLLERTVEQELMPMACELGLGVTPWSPLKGGALSGKYTRANAGEVKRDRGQLLESFLNEKTYTLVEELDVIAKAHDSTVARVALAWVRAQPGVSSTIIGARRLAQLEDNLKSVDVNLTSEELGPLDARTRPTLGFPQSLQALFPAFHSGGTTVNGVHAPSTFVLRRGTSPTDDTFADDPDGIQRPLRLASSAGRRQWTAAFMGAPRLRRR